MVLNYGALVTSLPLGDQVFEVGDESFRWKTNLSIDKGILDLVDLVLAAVDVFELRHNWYINRLVHSKTLFSMSQPNLLLHNPVCLINLKQVVVVAQLSNGQSWKAFFIVSSDIDAIKAKLGLFLIGKVRIVALIHFIWRHCQLGPFHNSISAVSVIIWAVVTHGLPIVIENNVWVDLLKLLLEQLVLLKNLDDILHAASSHVWWQHFSFLRCISTLYILQHEQLVGVVPADQQVEEPPWILVSLFRLINVSLNDLAAASLPIVMLFDQLLLFWCVLQQVQVDADLCKVFISQHQRLAWVSGLTIVRSENVRRYLRLLLEQVICSWLLLDRRGLLARCILFYIWIHF